MTRPRPEQVPVKPRQISQHRIPAKIVTIFQECITFADQVDTNNTKREDAFAMNRPTITILPLVAAGLLLGGCASTDEIKRLSDETARAQATADEAKALAQEALDIANQARSEASQAATTARSAMNAAERAQSDASQALSDAAEAKAAAARAEEKAERMFEKSIAK